MNVAKHISEDDLALFALALMQPEEAAFTLAHLKHCDLCRAEVARMQGDLVHYAMTAESVAPAAEARERLLRAVAKEKKFFAPAPAAEPVLTARSSDLLDRRTQHDEPAKRRMGAAGWAGWAIAACLAGLVGWQFNLGEDLRSQLSSQSAELQQARQPKPLTGDLARAQKVLETLTDPTAMQVALHLPAAAAATAKPEGHAAYSAATGNLVFVGSHLKRLDEGKTYELWLLPASGEAPMPAGLFKPDANGNASLVLPQLPRNVAAKGFGVTIEDDGGSDKPTPPIVLGGA